MGWYDLDNSGGFGLGDLGAAFKNLGEFGKTNGEGLGALLQGGAGIYGAIQQGKAMDNANALASRQLALAESEYARGLAKEDAMTAALNNTYGAAFAKDKDKDKNTLGLQYPGLTSTNPYTV